jgi:cysteine-rich repeat protein
VSEITLPIDGDACCPAGADATNDDDCPSVCGNGVVEPGETCEGAGCPTSCATTDACNPMALTGDPATCTSQCVGAPILSCTNGDGCCPDACNSTDDDDCSTSCGNGAVEAGETCDPPGTCPTACDDGIACTADTLVGSPANCNAACVYTPISAADDGSDGCCPAGANNNTDANCPVVCGNGATEMGELCDAACPTSCTPSGDACMPNLLQGTGCERQCVVTPVIANIDGDGCCLPGGTYDDDTDCPGVCGNAVVETGETCDDGNPFSFDGCSFCQTTDPETQCLYEAETERAETGACIECMCGESCRDALDLCYNSTDLATGGPAAGTPKSDLCAAVIDCGRAAGCTGTDCYGLVTPGPCRPQIQAAAESTALLTILNRQTDTSYAEGRANAIGDCSEANCSAECL